MSRNKKIILIIVVILLAFLLLISRELIFRFLFQGKNVPTNVKRLTNTTEYKKPTTTPQSLPPEPGRVKTDFTAQPPDGFPEGLPIEQKPIQIISSYIETFTGDPKLNEKPHTQITYSYVTKTSVQSAGDAFAKYFAANDFTVQKNYLTGKDGFSKQPLYTLGAGNTSDIAFTVTVTVFNKNLSQQIVTVSEITQK